MVLKLQNRVHQMNLHKKWENMPLTKNDSQTKKARQFYCLAFFIIFERKILWYNLK